MSESTFYETFAFALASKGEKFERITIKRNDVGADDVKLDIHYCGICHTDVHFANDDDGITKWPLVPGHELAGVVTAVGSNVRSVSVGSRVGVGCIVDCCMTCKYCQRSDEQYCRNGLTMKYSFEIKHGHIATEHGHTHGGYSGSIVVHERFIVRASKGGLRIGVVGIGGLGQMGIRLAVAMGNEVTALSSSAYKKAATIKLGASKFLLSTDEASMKAAGNSLDLILNTISAKHQLSPYLDLLDIDGVIVQLGCDGNAHELVQSSLIFRRATIAGSLIGGMNQTQECIDFCARHNIVISHEVVKADKLDEIHKILANKNDSVNRYVLDCKNSDHCSINGIDLCYENGRCEA